MFKNVSGQKIILYAKNSITGEPAVGDASNITGYVSKDAGSVTALADTSASELDATNAKGAYVIDLATGETNADMLLFTGKSSTANIFIDPVLVFTAPPNFNLASIDGSGVIKANLAQILGTALTETAGQIAAAFKQFFNIASPTSTMNTITAVTTAVNLTTNNDKTDYGISAVSVQAIWDAATSALTTVGSIGKWLVDKIDTTISSRLASGSYIAADNAGIAAIKTVTDALPDSGALTSIAQGADLATAQADLDILTGTDGAILATLQPNYAPTVVSDIPTATEIADETLKRDWSSITGEADRSLLNAARAIRNKSSLVDNPGYNTVYLEDDSTEAWRAAVTTDAGALPITGSDPV